MSNNFQNVPIHEKVTLTIKEAAEYSNIGINKIDAVQELADFFHVDFMEFFKQPIA